MRIAMLLSALLLAATASAQDFSYRYVEAMGYESKNNDTDITLDVAAATLSLQSQQGALLQVTMAGGEVDDLRRAEGGPEGDYRAFELFAGGARQLTSKTSAWTGVGVGKRRLEADNSRAACDQLTARFSLGLRHWLLPRMEGHASSSLVHLGDDDDCGITGAGNAEEVEDAELRLGLRFYLFPGLSLNAEGAYQFDERVEIFAAALRYDF